MSLEALRKQLRAENASKSDTELNASYWVCSEEKLQHCGVALLSSMAMSISAFLGLSATRDGRTVRVLIKMGKHEVSEYVDTNADWRQPPVDTLINQVVLMCPKDYEARLEAWYNKIYLPQVNAS